MDGSKKVRWEGEYKRKRGEERWGSKMRKDKEQ